MTSSTTTSSRSMESRTGRSNQRYNAKGERLVAGVVPLTEDKRFVLLIQSDRRKGWVLPKGGWETDEECQAAAQREAWEEAGIIVQIDYDLGDIVESRPPKAPSKTKKREKALYRFYEATVTSEENEWPEKSKRERCWMSYDDAHEALKDRPELLEALERSTMKRP
ncbi:nudix family protein [Ophiostoma piceae UAMH 11346]|uniref:Nudix family protein n=1 Tax=Ophiostoma piceae (strain UAMH 11346) TaxID=1262450 RepID=S3CZC6_OPHP1|nr:nudix family protein [Ophiostoma piceae UAMH 11346]